MPVIVLVYLLYKQTLKVVVGIFVLFDMISVADKYSSATVSTDNTFQDLPRLRKTADNNESYI
jgi:hypothetical protein